MKWRGRKIKNTNNNNMQLCVIITECLYIEKCSKNDFLSVILYTKNNHIGVNS